ncbi:hypothetical protein WA026_020085 [Henosepilachna vigintioctopunctata]|uniref:Structural maintenance of chromosomes protein n=1 Tax=Henosepilachna vigintioctopunctata TaxID=420089 RepID=A0AAW1U5R1_9CUCU
MATSSVYTQGSSTNENNQDPASEDEQLHLSDDEGINVDGIHIPSLKTPANSINSTGPRLIIRKIVNNFFKSYADTQTLGPFHKCFNAIIGPNGSGKSNVIDSMLFVFGYRATKIRCKKVSVLLHNSERHRDVSSATVEVHFAQIIDKEGDNYDILPNSEFVVSRTAMKDNSSFYTLNGRRVQFKEVAVLLKKHGIDLDHNRFLILQGEVEQISMMKCKAEGPNEPGMLEYLEDIIGTSRYIKPLEQLYERVEILTDARSEKVNRLKLVQKELEELKGPMDEAVEFLKAENKIANYKNVLYQKNIYDMEEQLQGYEEDKKVIETSKQELKEKKEGVTKLRIEKEEKLEAESVKYNTLMKKKSTLKEAFDKASNKDVQLQAEMVQVNKNRKKTMDLLAEEKKKLIQYEGIPSESEKGIKECDTKIQELAIKNEKLGCERTKLLTLIKTETQTLQEKKEVLETDLLALNKTVDETKSAFTLAESELKLCMSNEVNEKNKLEALKTAYENSVSLYQERKEQVATLKKKIPLTEESLKGATKEINIVRLKEEEIRNDINRKRAQLEESRSSMQAFKSRNKVINALMEQKQIGNCPGFFGRLGDLGAIDQKYDIAISTACGPLDYIVVDTVKTAQCPENVPRLFDLVKTQDDRLKTAFYFALRDTLVASNLEQASRIAYGARRYRVVTLAGDLIETTGTMSGGGKTVSKGRMGQSVAVNDVNPCDIEKLENDLVQAEKKFSSLREKEVALDKQMAALEPELRKMKIDYEKYSIELESLSQQHIDLKNQLKTQEERTKATVSDPAKVKKLTETMCKRKKEYEKATEVAGVLQVQVDELTKEIKEKTIGRMKKMDKEIGDVVKMMEKLKAEITRLKVSVKTAERNAKKSTEKITSMEQNITNFENQLRKMKSERDVIESDGEKLLKCIEEVETELSSDEYDFTEMKKEVEDLKKQLNHLKSEEVDVDQRLKSSKEKINELVSQIHQWNVKISQLKLQEIPDIVLEELKKYTKQELEEKNLESIERDLKLAEHQLKSIKPNLGVIQEYRKKQDVYMERAKELDEISQKRQDMKSLLDKIRDQRKQEFLAGFQTIRLKLKEMYQMITLGGDADFELVDTFDPFTEGIQFNVRPPKKSWKKISNLSGGEKTLSSLALVFALHYYKPSPLYVMDEIDAALDFKNVSIVGHYIKERTKNAQFIIISLRSQMFELCDNLVGIYKTYNCTKSVSIDPRIYEDKQSQVEHSQKELPVKDSVVRENTETNNHCSNPQFSEEQMDFSSDTDKENQSGRIIDDSFESS